MEEQAHSALVPGSVKARLVYGAFAGQPVQVVDSPPGAGKSQLVIDVLDVLLRRSDLNIVVACPTRRGAEDLAGRLARALGGADTDPVVVLGVSGASPVAGTCLEPPVDRRAVTVRTIASCAISPPDIDLLIIDEAYQATFADVASAGDAADSIILVGDPGQIGPVVTQDVTTWERAGAGPHRRAPEVFAERADAVSLQLGASYRLGPDTVWAIGPLYDFEFGSARLPRHVVTPEAEQVPEVRSLEIVNDGGVADFDMLTRLAGHASDFVGATVIFPDSPDVTLEPSDVACVVSHNVQASTLQAILRGNGLGAITVGTADRLQGGQWHAVVALDPLVGHTTVSPHQINSGRLCVMASRHMSTLLWVHDGRWEDQLAVATKEHPEAAVGAEVRRRLTGL